MPRVEVSELNMHIRETAIEQAEDYDKKTFCIITETLKKIDIEEFQTIQEKQTLRRYVSE